MDPSLLLARIDDDQIETDDEKIDDNRTPFEIPRRKRNAGQNDDAETNAREPLRKRAESHQETKEPDVLRIKHRRHLSLHKVIAV
jgi:hypothetical protein